MRTLTLALGLLLSLSFTTQAQVEDDTSATALSAEKVDIVLETNMGKIELELNQALAPISVANFVKYAETGFYDNTIFHRVINNFMVQGGGFDKYMRQKPTLGMIKNEAKNGLKNDRGTVAMARTSAVDSASSQFFINHKDNDFLNHGGRDYGYAVFGKVTKGMDVVDAIARVRTKSGDVPVNPVVLKKVYLKEVAPTEAEAANAQ